MPAYRILLYLFPASFRAEYGSEMCAIFARRRNSTAGVGGVMTLWVSTIIDVVVDAVRVHGDVLRQDLRYSAHSLMQSPGFALTAIIVTAIGIGANTAVFTLTDHVLIRSLPFVDSARLVTLWESVPGYGHSDVSPANYRDWKHLSTSFQAISAYRGLTVNLTGQLEPQRVDGASVTFDLFPMLGIEPWRGRVFHETDDVEDAAGTVLLSYGLWQSVFARDPDLIGKTVRLDGTPFTIIGVMPEGFYFPNRDAQLWTAMRFAPPDFVNRTNAFLHVVGKLKSSVSLERAQSEMRLIASQLEHQYPKENQETSVAVVFLRDAVSAQSRMLLFVLSGAALGVLLIACANLVHLLLSRALVRRKELAVRTALGAGRERLIRQLLTEGLILSTLGGSAGILVAIAALPLLAHLVPHNLPIAEIPTMNFNVLIFGTVLTALTGIAFSAIPAWRACAKADLSGLREGAHSGIAGRKERFRSTLIVAEISISLVLLVACGLLFRALLRVRATDPGFQSEGVLTMRTVLTMPKYEKTADRVSFYARVLDQVRALPGVSKAAYVSFLPMVLRGGVWPVDIEGREWKPAEQHSASLRFVTPGYFDTMGIPLRAGRDVSESDTADAPFYVVVSESFARRYWPGQDAIGRKFDFASHERTVAGVVGDIRLSGIEAVSDPQVYLPYKQVQDGVLTWFAPKDLVIATHLRQQAILPSVRQIIRTADPELPLSEVRPLKDIVAGETVPRSAQVRVLSAFAAVAILLAGIGIHGLLSFTVSRRMNEIGVRIALGAQRSDILHMVFRESIRLAYVGISSGILLAYAVGRVFQSLLAGIPPADTVTFATAVALCVVMTILGSLIPAARATRVDPLKSIRS